MLRAKREPGSRHGPRLPVRAHTCAVVFNKVGLGQALRTTRLVVVFVDLIGGGGAAASWRCEERVRR